MMLLIVVQVFVEQCRELDIAIAASSAGAASMARQALLRRQAAAAAAASAAGEDGSSSGSASARPPLGASAGSLAASQVRWHGCCCLVGFPVGCYRLVPKHVRVAVFEDVLRRRVCTPADWPHSESKP